MSSVRLDVLLAGSRQPRCSSPDRGLASARTQRCSPIADLRELQPPSRRRYSASSERCRQPVSAATRRERESLGTEPTYEVGRRGIALCCRRTPLRGAQAAVLLLLRLSRRFLDGLLEPFASFLVLGTLHNSPLWLPSGPGARRAASAAGGKAQELGRLATAGVALHRRNDGTGSRRQEV